MELHPLKMAALVGAGGALGALARFYTGLWVGRWAGTGWPWGTLTVNLLGCLLLGLLTGLSVSRQAIPSHIAAVVMTGFLGAFTTFSTFSVEGVKLWRATGSLGPTVSYVLVSVLGGLLLAAAGYGLGHLGASPPS